MKNEPFFRSPEIWVAGIMVLSTFLVYVPFLLSDFSLVTRHYDGPFYMYIAKTFYQIPVDHPFRDSLPPIYYAAHLPLYPVLIRALTLITAGNYPLAMVMATLVSSVAAALLFFKLLQVWNLVKSPLWTTTLFCFLPPRWLFQHSIGASEPLFICFVFAAFLALHKQNVWLVIAAILLASTARITGLLLIPVFGLIYLHQRKYKNVLLLPLALLGIIGVFFYYRYVYGDFFAFFNWHLSKAVKSNLETSSLIKWNPLEIFRFYAARPNFHSTELYLMLYAIFLTGTIALWKRRRELFIYCLIFFLFSCFIFHYDLPRILLAFAPFAILVGFDDILSRWSFRIIVFPFLLYLSYIYVWGWLPLAVCSPQKWNEILRQIAL